MSTCDIKFRQNTDVIQSFIVQKEGFVRILHQLMKTQDCLDVYKWKMVESFQQFDIVGNTNIAR